jgi:hypothetical protein
MKWYMSSKIVHYIIILHPMAVQSTMPRKAKKPLMKNVSPTMKSQTELVAEIAKISVVNA